MNQKAFASFFLFHFADDYVNKIKLKIYNMTKTIQFVSL